ncbi:MerR family transcriptional regulator [Brevundimonas sp. LM2]|uniref:MerR family transcriptional regulator n=1 Tax=Brevundimonas sp. LM2 TaxID=1938605 RepID=UPI000983AC16|nr:MerR family transcriptional regulator [Brevundimonas sp. LM2]AQR62000.1 MerR family transcriptional regulator [Brevundimonas sp. LM2]
MAKSPNAFRSISEAAEAVGAPQHVLRFWETKFPFIAPVKRAGGRRFYRPQDIVLLKAIRRLLHDEGLTIRGVQRLHKDQGLARLAAYGDPEGIFVMAAAPSAELDDVDGGSAEPTGGADVRLRAVLADLEAARARLDAVLTA